MLTPGTSLELKRRQCGLTQQEVAEYIGISRKTFAAYENGDKQIPLSVFIKLADLYECDVYEIYGVHAEKIENDVPVIELSYAHARYKAKEEAKVTELIGVNSPKSVINGSIKNIMSKNKREKI